MSDISSYDKRAAAIFKIMLENGEPVTSYELMKKGYKIATIHRHLSDMTKLGEIKTYKDTNVNGKKRKPYGPTIHGISNFYNIDSGLKQRLEEHFDRWINKDDFVKELIEAGFDENKINTEPKKTKQVFRKLIQFYAEIWKQIDEFSNDPYSVPLDTLAFIGGMLVVRKKEYATLWEELYSFLPGFRKPIREYNASITHRIVALDNKYN